MVAVVGLDAFLEHHGTLGHAHLHLLRVGQRPEFLVGWVDGLVQGGAVVDLGADGAILRKQHLGAFDSGHMRGVLALFVCSVLNNFRHVCQVYATRAIWHTPAHTLVRLFALPTLTTNYSRGERPCGTRIVDS